MACNPPVQQLPPEDYTYTFEIFVDGPSQTGNTPTPNLVFSSAGLREFVVADTTYAEQQYAFGTTNCPLNFPQPCGEMATVPTRDLFRDIAHNGTILRPVHARLRAHDIPLPSYIDALNTGGLFNPAPLLAPYEAHLFSTDYDLATLELLTTTVEFSWLALTKNRAPAVVLPATVEAFGSTPTDLRLVPTQFNRLLAPGTSIQSVYLSQAGACSQEFDYKTFFAQIDQRVRSSLFTQPGGDHTASRASCFQSGVSTLNLNYDNFSSFIAHTPSLVQDLRGGFIFNGSAHVQLARGDLATVDLLNGVAPGPDERCDAAFSAGFELSVGTDGVIKAESSFKNGGVDAAGHPFPFAFSDQATHACRGVHFLNIADADGLSETLYSVLHDQIPQGVHDTAQALQMFPPFDDRDPARDQLFACDPTKADPNLTCPAITSEQCGAAADEISQTALHGAQGFGMPLADATLLANTISATDGNGHLLHWRCVHFDSVTSVANSCFRPTDGRCEMIVPIKRLNPRPHAVEAVLFDRFDELTNPALAMFYASFVTTPPAGPVDFTRAFDKLCARKRAPLLGPGIDFANFYNEEWEAFHGGQQTCPDNETPPLPCSNPRQNGRRSCDTGSCFEFPAQPATDPVTGKCN